MDLRTRIFQYTKNLKGIRNENGDFYYVNLQVPEDIAAEKKEMNAQVKLIKTKNLDLPDDQQIKYAFKNKRLYVNNELQKKAIQPPTATELFNLDKQELDKIAKMQMFASAPLKEKGSKFTAYAFKVTSNTDIRRAYKKIKLMHPEADHVVLVYNLMGEVHGNDDGEHGAALRLQESIQTHENMAVMVARVYGGQLLGPRRFLLMGKVVEDAISNMN